MSTLVPSTPVLLRPRNINEGFAEAVSSPQVTTAGTRFVFGAVPEPSGVAHQPTSEEQADFEGGPDRDGDADAELDLLADDDHGAEDLSLTHAATSSDQDLSTNAGNEEVPSLEAGAQDLSQPETAPPPVSQPSAPNIRPQMR